MALIAMLALLIGFTIWADAAQAGWPKLSGRASVFGNDPFQGFNDYEDNCRTATGTSCTAGGIAVMRYSTLGGWWRVCAPRQILRKGVKRCHIVRQSEIGPATWTGRVTDISAVTARRAWRLRARYFPTDRGRWILHYLGRRRHAHGL